MLVGLVLSRDSSTDSASLTSLVSGGHLCASAGTPVSGPIPVFPLLLSSNPPSSSSIMLFSLHLSSKGARDGFEGPHG